MIFFGLLGCGLLLMNFNGAPLKGIMQNQMEWRKTARFYDAKVTPPTSKVNPDIDPQAKADRITYRVVPGFRQIQGEQPWQCHLNERVGETEGPQNIDRALLWPEMRHLFNFSTYIDFTDLRILFMGDSVGDHLAMFLERMMVADNFSDDRGSDDKITTTTIFRKCNGCGGGPGMHLTAPLANNKGAIAGWRMTGMFLRDSEGWAQPNWNRGWNREDVHTLRAAVNKATTTTTTATTRVATNVHNNSVQSSNNTNTTAIDTSNISSNINANANANAADEGNFDVFVFRIPSSSWIPFEAITNESLTETIKLANELFGIRKVILVTMHHNNNNWKANMREEMLRKNEMIRQFAYDWTSTTATQQLQNRNNNNKNDNNSSSSGGSSVDAVYVLENGRLNDAMMEFNARIIGFDTKSNYTEEAKLAGTKMQQMSVAHVCAERVKDGSLDCKRNSITSDGQHLCMNIVGQRVNAALACIMQCAYDNKQQGQGQGQGKNTSDDDNGWVCATACNDRFMSLEQVIV